MIQHRPMSQCASPTQHVSGTVINVHTTRNSVYKGDFLLFVETRFILTVTVKLRPIKSKGNSLLKLVFQFQVFPIVSIFFATC